MEHRRYSQFCALATALDVVGERWTLLIIRELLAGPRRYTDLMAGLPGISTNLLSERLKSLEQQGLVGRRPLPPPASSTVYALTPLGQALESALIELGRWGAPFLPDLLEGVAPPSLGAITLALKAFFQPDQAGAINEIYELHLGHEALQIHVNAGELQVRAGLAGKPDAVFYTELPHFLSLFTGRIKPKQAVSRGLIRVEGDPGTLSRFVTLFRVPRS